MTRLGAGAREGMRETENSGRYSVFSNQFGGGEAGVGFGCG